MLWSILIGLVLITMVFQIARLECDVRKLKSEVARLGSVVSALVDLECPEFREDDSDGFDGAY